jgi:uncharacterized membrane protein YdjX (TVP38/TMEM64 family)
MIPAAEHAERKPTPWTLIFLAVVLIAAGAAWLLLPLREWLGLFERWITGLGAWGVALFALIYILATISLAPEWPLTIAAGLLYGAWGFPISLGTATIAASLALLIARRFARDRVRSLLKRRRIFSAIDDAVAEEGWKVVALLRLSPAVPFNLQNYLFGVTAIPFWRFVTATLGGIIPYYILGTYYILGSERISDQSSSF